MSRNKFMGFGLKSFIIALAVILLVSYGVFNARNLIIGPSIEIFSPSEGTEITEKVITVNGRAKNVAFISLNGKPIFVDTEGMFEEKILLSPGSNVIEIKARDRFENKTEEIIKIYYKPSTITNDQN